MYARCVLSGSNPCHSSRHLRSSPRMYTEHGACVLQDCLRADPSSHRLLHHQRQQRVYHLRSSKHCRFPTIIVDRRHFDDVASDDVEPFQTVEDGQQLPRAPASDFCRASGCPKRQPRVQDTADSLVLYLHRAAAE